MSGEAWIPTFNGKGRHLGYFEFAELAGRIILVLGGRAGKRKE
ncbi:MAG: hypothetical protein QXT28_11745 [Thermofilaceae archaeon]